MHRLAAILVFALALPLVAPASALAAPWLGPAGEPLPFADDEAVIAFLIDAEVTARKQLGDGINRPFKLTLERDGVVAHAIFRTVEIERRDPRPISERHFRDSYVFEVAAYRLSRLLELDNVPPAVLRTLDGRDGSVQLWVEEADTEAARHERREPPAQPARWSQQQQIMRVFDSLIYNFDRNHGNMLVDRNGKLWFVDHTRSFKRWPKLPSPERINVCERDLWQRLQELSRRELRKNLEPYLDGATVDSVLRRHRQLIRHFEGLIAELGEEAVLYDFDPEGTAPSVAQPRLALLER